jgi:hypothetical protein
MWEMKRERGNSGLTPLRAPGLLLDAATLANPGAIDACEWVPSQRAAD